MYTYIQLFDIQTFLHTQFYVYRIFVVNEKCVNTSICYSSNTLSNKVIMPVCV